MDGFAVASADGAAPRIVSGAVRMGADAPHALARGTAMRVPTGGTLPAGADAVVPQEDADETPAGIVPHESPQPGDYVTQRADDVRAGERVLAAGRRIGGPELSVLATLGIVRVPVFRRPRVAIVSTGDELVDPGATLATGQIRDSNRYAVAGALRAMGAEPVQFPRAADTAEGLEAAFAAALAVCDALVTTGGSSVGERDLVPRAVVRLGAPGPIVHGLRVKPGKPTLLAAAGAKPVVGLPGNPASALMILEAVVRPIVAALTGEAHARAVVLEAFAAEPFAGRAGWTWFVPARLTVRDGALAAHPLRLRSAQTSLLARAAGFVTLGERAAPVAAGERVAVTLYSGGGAPIEAA